MLREGEGWRKGEAWSSRVNPDGPINPEAIKIHRIWPADLKNAPRFHRDFCRRRKTSLENCLIVAHAYKNERDFLDYEFARAKVIERGESAYAEERYICTQVLFAQLFPGASKSLNPMCADEAEVELQHPPHRRGLRPLQRAPTERRSDVDVAQPAKSWGLAGSSI